MTLKEIVYLDVDSMVHPDNREHLHVIMNTETNRKYRTIILTSVLCGCETWSLIIKKECRLKVSRVGC
jgi:hypothetical protein